jgi:hypothetical protein
MWTCPKCESKVDDSFDICWSCGTTPEGVEDPLFVTADESELIEDPVVDRKFDFDFDDSLEDFAGTPLPELAELYMADNLIEAGFVAERLREEGIAAIADGQPSGGSRAANWGGGFKVRIRLEDLPRAQAWLARYERPGESKP